MRPLPWLAALALVACTRPAPLAPGGEGCGPACARVRECKLGAETTPNGTTCEAVCDAVTREGADFGVACLVAAKTCEEARNCR